MDFWLNPARISLMQGKRAAALPALILVGLLAAALLAAPDANAAVGVEKASRSAGAPGDRVTLTLTCGFCFPPCKGPKGERHPEGFEHGPCMLDSDADPPASFGVSLVPIAKAPTPKPCGPNAVCAPQAQAPPGRAPFAFLGLATPPPGGNNPEHGDPPRYLLEFEVPDLRAGLYAYVIYCDVCLKGKGGSLIAAPATGPWRLRVRATTPGRALSGAPQAPQSAPPE